MTSVLSAPRVTVLMAVFNGQDYVGEAIRSILNQSQADFEFLIVEDGSTDGTEEVVRAFSDPRIRLLVNPENLGLARSLNRGLAEARGEFVARQDADDVSEPDRLRRQVDFLDSNPEVALVGTWYVEIDADGRPGRRRTLPTEYLDLRWALLFYCPFVHSATMWRREPVSARFGGYHESLRYSMDFELWSRIARAYRVRNLDEYLVRIRLHPAAMTATYGEGTAEGHRLRVATIARMLGWSERGLGPPEIESRFRSLDTLARGLRIGGAPEPVEEVVPDLLRLQEMFMEEAGVDRLERSARRSALRRQVARTLVRMAAGNFRGRPDVASSGSLLWAAAGMWVQIGTSAGMKEAVAPQPGTIQSPPGSV